MIIRDETMGRSYEFVPTRQGYFEADAKIKEITGSGHSLGGDISKVRDYCGSQDGSFYTSDSKPKGLFDW